MKSVNKILILISYFPKFYLIIWKTTLSVESNGRVKVMWVLLVEEWIKRMLLTVNVKSKCTKLFKILKLWELILMKIFNHLPDKATESTHFSREKKTAMKEKEKILSLFITWTESTASSISMISLVFVLLPQFIILNVIYEKLLKLIRLIYRHFKI